MENKRTWIYCRVAHPDAHALAMQQSSLEAYAEANGFAVVGTTAEQASGLDFSRQGLAEVSGAVADGKIDFLLVANLSRLGRDVGKTDAYLCWLDCAGWKIGLLKWSVPMVRFHRRPPRYCMG